MTASPSQFDEIAFGVSAFVELLKNVFEIIAIAAGGTWTYFNFFKGRTYRPRLECEVDGSIETHSGRVQLKVVVKARNVGLSRVSIEQKGTILQAYPAVAQNAAPSWPCQVTWSLDPAVFDVFKDHGWIEPSEPIEDQVLIELPDDNAPAYKLTLKVLSQKISWTARNIVQGPVADRIIGGVHDQSARPETNGSAGGSRDPGAERKTTTQRGTAT